MSPPRVRDRGRGASLRGLFPRLASLIQRQLPEFGGHRTLLWAAPRLALVSALAPLCVFALHLLRDSWWLLLVTSLLLSGLVAVLSYLLLTVVGVIERDNEDQAAQLARAYQALKMSTTTIHHDLDRARVVQERMLPDLAHMPLTDRLEWGAAFVPQEKVGGDYFDAATLGPGRVAILFSDASGHGLSAALLTALLKSSFQSWVEEDWSLAGFVRLLNHRLFTLTPDHSYATAILAIFDATTSELSYCNCGHNPEPLLIGPARSAVQRLDDARNLSLGLLEGFTPRVVTVKLAADDVVVLATDGVTEALNETEEEFGVERLESYLVEQRSAPVGALARGLAEAVRLHAGKGALRDDLAVLAFRLRP